MKCPKCGTQLTELEDGTYQCPDCNRKFRTKKADEVNKNEATPSEAVSNPATEEETVSGIEREAADGVAGDEVVGRATSEATDAEPTAALDVSHEAPHTERVATEAPIVFPTSVGIGDIKRKSKMDLKGNFGYAILTMILLNLTLFGAATIGLVIGAILISGAVTSSNAAFFVDIATHKMKGIDNTYRGFKRFGGALGVNVLSVVFIIIPIVACSILYRIIAIVMVTGGSWAICLAFEIILILVAIIVCIPLLFIRQMSFYVLNDNPDISANQCYDITAKLVKQNFGKVLLLNLSFIGWWLLVLLTLGALNVYVAPYYKTSVANLYLSLKGTVVKS